MNVTVIAAVAENDVIGKDGDIPWQYPEDLRHFKERTLGSPVIVGRVTYESIVDRLGGPLPGRLNIVLTGDPERVETAADIPASAGRTADDISTDGPWDGETSVRTATTVEEALGIARDVVGCSTETGDVFVAGGASVYEQFLPIADRMILTEIREIYDGDTEFPDWDDSDWIEVSREEKEELSFVTYRRQ